MRPKVVLFGDSITEESFGDGGWGAALANHFSRTADVVLRGYSGYNTRWALKVAPQAMDAISAAGEQPLVLAVFFGANDASLADRSSGFQHVPLDEYQSNLRSIISFFKIYATILTCLLYSLIDWSLGAVAEDFYCTYHTTTDR